MLARPVPMHRCVQAPESKVTEVLLQSLPANQKARLEGIQMAQQAFVTEQPDTHIDQSHTEYDRQQLFKSAPWTQVVTARR